MDPTDAAEAAREQASPRPTAPVPLGKGASFDLEGNLLYKGTTTAPVVTITVPKALTKLAAKDGRSPLVTKIVVTGQKPLPVPGVSSGGGRICSAEVAYTFADGAQDQLLALQDDVGSRSRSNLEVAGSRLVGQGNVPNVLPADQRSSYGQPDPDTGDNPPNASYLTEDLSTLTLLRGCTTQDPNSIHDPEPGSETVLIPYPTDADIDPDDGSPDDYPQHHPLASIWIEFDPEGAVSVGGYDVTDYAQDLSGTWVACEGLGDKAALESGCES